MVPFRQVSAYQTLKKVINLCETAEISIFACHGTLLGAARSGSFAGRPKDLDFYISDTDFVTLMRCIKFLNRDGFFLHKCKTRKGVLHFKSKVGVPVSFTIYQKQKGSSTLERCNDYFVGQEQIMRGLGCLLDERPFDIDWKNDAVGMNINVEKGLTKKIFALSVKIPDNYLELLQKQYGKYWETPKGKQFS